MQFLYLCLLCGAVRSLALVVKSPSKMQSLIELRNRRKARMQMLAGELPLTQPPEGCISCFGVQVVYGKYASGDGDQTDNSYWIFKDPALRDPNVTLPIVIQFHPGGFYSGAPWKVENKEIKEYVSKGFAVLSVGYRLVTEKYFYQSRGGENKTEELIHVSKDGKLSLDSEGKTMEDYKVRVGKQEFITKYLYDSTQMMEHLIDNAEQFGLDINRIVFTGESSGGAGMQYLTWVYHQWNQGRFTPVGMVYHNAQLNIPVHNMLGKTWGLFADTLGPQTRLGDVVSQRACPNVVGNDLCGSALGNLSDYDLCNEEWNKRALKEFCGEALESGVTLGEMQKRQVWPKEDEDLGKGMEKLWYSSENMQHHKPSEPFYIYAANSMNGSSATDVAHHSIFALNFAKFAEMGKHGGHQYTVYYTDFAKMTEADRGMERLEVSATASDLGNAMLPRAAGSPGAAPASAVLAAPSPAQQRGGRAPAPAPMPAPAPGPAAAGTFVFNYLSTHAWREDVGVKDVEAGSLEERVLYACLAAKIGPFKAFPVEENKTVVEDKSGAPLPSIGIFITTLVTMLICYS